MNHWKSKFQIWVLHAGSQSFFGPPIRLSHELIERAVVFFRNANGLASKISEGNRHRHQWNTNAFSVLPIVRSNRSGSNPPAPYAKRRYAALRRNADVWVMGRCHRLLSTFWSNVWLRRPTANIDGLPKTLECFGCDWDSHSVTDLYCRWLGRFRRVFCAVLPVIPSCGTSGWTFLVSTSEHK